MPSGLTAAPTGSENPKIEPVGKFVDVFTISTTLSLNTGMYASPAFTVVVVIVAVTGLVPVFIALNEAILPVPLAAKPMPGALFTQLYVFPVPVKLIAAVAAPLATV